ncbi:transposase [Coraliomargarita sp. W4R72]
MYRWRKMSDVERTSILEARRVKQQPLHSPPHREGSHTRQFLLNGACYEHRPYIGISADRMEAFSQQFLQMLHEEDATVCAWCVLPNHYHFLIQSQCILHVLKSVGKFHGRTAFMWNGEDSQRGRKVFYRAVEREMRSDRHFWSSLNYVHHNPVRHGYVSKWMDWPWSSASDFLTATTQTEALRIWQEYPLLNYGEGWDDPEL